MLKHTKEIEELYQDIQRKLYYMIPEKWDELYLYASVIDRLDGDTNGELFFYYIPKGIFRKKPVSCYEIPAKFNLAENDYLKLVDILYAKIKELREQQQLIDKQSGSWSNLTLTIKNNKFRIVFDYEDLANSDFNSYERHVIWRYNILGVSLEQCTREEREIIKRYQTGVKKLNNQEEYETGIYIKNVKNIVDYTTPSYDSNAKDIEYIADEEKYSNGKKNQILSKTEGRQREYDIFPEDNAKSRNSAYEIEVKVEDEKPTIRRFTVK